MEFPFCTISTSSHLFKAFALADSLLPFGGVLYVLVIDEPDHNTTQKAPKNVQWVAMKALDSELAANIKSKYSKQADKLRWSLKSVLLHHLLAHHDKVAYIDNDMYFYHDFSFLFAALEEHPILLTPHHYPSDPTREENWLEANYRVGLYNAGFIGVNKEATDMLRWWGACCLYRCEKNAMRGLFDDQKYLDLVPVKYPKTKIVQHKGCNVAEWNAKDCPKVKVNNSIVIDGKYDLIFYHYNGFSVKEILADSNHVMKSNLGEYLMRLKKYNPDITMKDLSWKNSYVGRFKLGIWEILNKCNKRKSAR